MTDRDDRLDAFEARTRQFSQDVLRLLRVSVIAMGKELLGRRVLAVVALLVLVVSSGSARTATVTFEKIFPLKANEGVFAYARISPNGRYLAYASEMPRSTTQIETVVDLKDQSVVFTEPGIDGYFSNDNERMILLSFARGQGGVTIWHQRTGALSGNV